MYILIVYNRFDEHAIDAALGPFETSEEAHDKYHELFGYGFRRVSYQKLTTKLPEWSM